MTQEPSIIRTQEELRTFFDDNWPEIEIEESHLRQARKNCIDRIVACFLGDGKINLREIGMILVNEDPTELACIEAAKVCNLLCEATCLIGLFKIEPDESTSATESESLYMGNTR